MSAISFSTPARSQKRDIRPFVIPVVAGILAAIAMFGGYILILTVFQDFSHAMQQAAQDWLWVGLVALGFGTQIGLYIYLRIMIHAAKAAGATALTGAGTGTSTLGMIACCAHHLTDIAPSVAVTGASGLSSAIGFFTEWKYAFIGLGLAMNAVGIRRYPADDSQIESAAECDGRNTIIRHRIERGGTCTDLPLKGMTSDMGQVKVASGEANPMPLIFPRHLSQEMQNVRAYSPRLEWLTRHHDVPVVDHLALRCTIRFGIHCAVFRMAGRSRRRADRFSHCARLVLGRLFVSEDSRGEKHTCSLIRSAANVSSGSARTSRWTTKALRTIFAARAAKPILNAPPKSSHALKWGKRRDQISLATKRIGRTANRRELFSSYAAR